jgi:hypothetical protein
MLEGRCGDRDAGDRRMQPRAGTARPRGTAGARWRSRTDRSIWSPRGARSAGSCWRTRPDRTARSTRGSWVVRPERRGRHPRPCWTARSTWTSRAGRVPRAQGRASNRCPTHYRNRQRPVCGRRGPRGTGLFEWCARRRQMRDSGRQRNRALRPEIAAQRLDSSATALTLMLYQLSRVRSRRPAVCRAADHASKPPGLGTIRRCTYSPTIRSATSCASS